MGEKRGPEEESFSRRRKKIKGSEAHEGVMSSVSEREVSEGEETMMRLHERCGLARKWGVAAGGARWAGSV